LHCGLAATEPPLLTGSCGIDRSFFFPYNIVLQHAHACGLHTLAVALSAAQVQPCARAATVFTAVLVIGTLRRHYRYP
jgi:hypothetical protein